MRITKEQAAVLIIDYQEKLMPVMHGREKLIENSGILLSGLKELGVPSVITQQYTKGLGMTVPEITAAAGTNKFIEKISFSAFKEVLPLIQEKKYIIVCGIEAHICVLQTVTDLKSAGFIPVLAVDCISSRKEYNIRAACQRAQAEGAVLTTYEALLFELLQEAGTKTSKIIQRLVK